MTQTQNPYLEGRKADTRAETDRKCPDCGAALPFDPEAGRLKCPYCGHEEDVPKAETEPERAAELDFDAAEHLLNCDWGVSKKSVLCHSCGAECVYDALQTADVCPYCGSNQVMEAHEADTVAPGGVCPFEIPADAAAERFRKWLKGKWFCPSAAKKNAKPDQISGVYLPFWTFDTDTFSYYTARYGKNRRVRSSDGKHKTVTDWYSTRGHYQETIDDELSAGSNRWDERLMRGLEPFDTGRNQAYRPEYVAGFAAERYSIGLKDAWESAKADIDETLTANVTGKIRSETRADHVRNVVLNTTYRAVTYKYLLLPVWISAFGYKGKVYQFMVNGQTGRVSGRAPVSALRVILFVLALIAVAALLALLFAEAQ